MLGTARPVNEEARYQYRCRCGFAKDMADNSPETLIEVVSHHRCRDVEFTVTPYTCEHCGEVTRFADLKPFFVQGNSLAICPDCRPELIKVILGR